ncbi:MAG: TIGR01440 family protein [Dehalobacter sp. 4CP]|uniref:TIGR01440 family protein n=1 Tax=Dehalobacter sp. CP TaxID=2594474 RepID=UPI0013CBB4E7|nr:TIGR01440 family protein [Dehalobacter sp.]NBJ15861.1 TIGR01440 family protein [Dehalobacter sp. 4CP]
MTDKKEMLRQIKDEWEHILQAFEDTAGLKPGQLLVVGCSTSEIIGEKIGKAGSKEVADVLFEPLRRWADKLGIFLAVQCCEHLNRALIVERSTADRLNFEPVVVIPSLSAGGAMSLAAWGNFFDPVAVEQIRADAGIDIGDTLIGMHLRPVAVPLRIDVRNLGAAHLNLAKARPKYVGGPRAAYPCD